MSEKTGMAISSIMGFFWCLAGALALPQAGRVGAMAAAFLVSGALLYANASRPTAASKFNRKIFSVAVAFEVVGIAAAVWLLTRSHEPTLIVPVIAVIVGLHFIGMWLATDNRTYLGIAVAMSVAGLGSTLLPFPARMQVAALASAIILWAGAAQRLNKRSPTA
jgi:hypothetical protein